MNQQDKGKQVLRYDYHDELDDCYSNDHAHHRPQPADAHTHREHTPPPILPASAAVHPRARSESSRHAETTTRKGVQPLQTSARSPPQDAARESTAHPSVLQTRDSLPSIILHEPPEQHPASSASSDTFATLSFASSPSGSSATADCTPESSGLVHTPTPTSASSPDVSRPSSPASASAPPSDNPSSSTHASSAHSTISHNTLASRSAQPNTPSLHERSSPQPPHNSSTTDSGIRPVARPDPRTPSTSTATTHPFSASLGTGFADTDIDDAELLMPGQILPLLRCPLCPFGTLLQAPITLHCGHTVCSKHVIRPHTEASSSSRSAATGVLSSILPSSSTKPLSPSSTFKCPLPTCGKVSANPSTPVHPHSGVGFRPAPGSGMPTPPTEVPAAPRVDVTVNKILTLTVRTQSTLNSRTDSDRVETTRALPASDDELSDEDGDVPSAFSTLSRRPRSSSPPSPSRRPRKRRRLPPRTSAPNPPPHPSESDSRPTASPRSACALFEKELLIELTCEICFALLWQPVTTPCQHTFCSKCLLRSMDHSTACPLCRQDIPSWVYAQDQPCNKVVLSIILKAFPAPYAEREAMIQAEERDNRLDTPIFVCQLSFPGMPTMLHLFEPRYRLMLRRCINSPNPSFGMIPPPRPSSTTSAPGNDFGTMLRIKNVTMLPDGRSVVETWGTWRFRIMERGMLDGYVVARVERIDDFEEEVQEADEANVQEVLEGSSAAVAAGSSSVPSRSQAAGLLRSRVSPTNEELIRICHDFLDQLKEGTPWVVQHLDANYVAMPTDPVQFCFWMALLLPIDEHEKAKLLPIRSPRLRLRLVVHWIEQLRSHWAISYANASRWQVVLWWMYRFLVRILRPERRDRRMLLAAYGAVVIAVVWAQVAMYRNERVFGTAG